MNRAGWRSGGRRWLACAAVSGLAVLAPVGLVAADDDDPPKEAYPPQSTAPAVTPTTRPIPKTGNEGTDTWVKLGAGAVLVGGVMVAAASRRRREVVAS